MLVLAHVDTSLEAARERLQKIVSSGAALECFRKNVEAQGGEPRVCDDPDRFLPLVTETFKVESPRSGFITKVDTAEIGHAIAAIGGGRVRIDDRIDPTVGFVAEVKIGDRSAPVQRWARSIAAMKHTPVKQPSEFNPPMKSATNLYLKYRDW